MPLTERILVFHGRLKWHFVEFCGHERQGYVQLFRVGMCAAQDSKLAPRCKKKNSPKIDTPFWKWANFL